MVAHLPLYVRGDPSNQGLRETYADYDGSPLNYRQPHHVHSKDDLLQYCSFRRAGRWHDRQRRRNSVRQPGISQLGHGHYSRSFKLAERFAVKFKWEVFNVLNHAMFAITKLGQDYEQRLSESFSRLPMSDWA